MRVTRPCTRCGLHWLGLFGFRGGHWSRRRGGTRASWVAVDEFDREDTAELLATALGGTGRRPEALEVIRAVRRALAGRGLVERETLAEIDRDLLGVDRPPARPDQAGDVGESVAVSSTTAWASSPLARTTFVTRQIETAELVTVLDTCRIVTVLGPGGIGKTRLAVEASSQIAARSQTRVGFVDLERRDREEEVADLAESSL